MVLENGEKKSEKAVSPVIGVILIVAITVILGAVVGTAALGFGDQVEQNVRAGVDVSTAENGEAKVSWVAQGNADYLNVSITGDAIFDDDGGLKEGPVRINSTGSSMTVLPKEGATGPVDRVHVRGSGDVAYYDATGGNIEISSCDGICESFDGIITDASDPTGYTKEVRDNPEIQITVVAAKEDGTKTTVLSKEIGS